jgi:hypothetical protein
MRTVASGDQTFENETSLYPVAWGGSGSNLFVSTSGADEFFGGSGEDMSQPAAATMSSTRTPSASRAAGAIR